MLGLQRHLFLKMLKLQYFLLVLGTLFHNFSTSFSFSVVDIPANNITFQYGEKLIELENKISELKQQHKIDLIELQNSNNETKATIASMQQEIEMLWEIVKARHGTNSTKITQAPTNSTPTHLVGIPFPNTTESMKIFVNTSAQLHTALASLTPPGTVIQLSEGTFVGEFTISQNNVKLVGRGPSTILRFDLDGIWNKFRRTLSLLGNHCEVSNLRIHAGGEFSRGIYVGGGNNSVSSVQMNGGSYLLYIEGDHNSFSEMSLENGYYGINIIKREGNRFRNITVNNMSGACIDVAGDGNSLESFTCRNAPTGLFVADNGNKVNGFEYEGKAVGQQRAVVVQTGRGTMLQNLFCKYKSNSRVVFRNDAREVRMDTVGCGPVWMDGSGHMVTNLDEKVVIEGTREGYRMD